MATLIPGWLRWYKKPSYVDLKAFAQSLNRRTEESEVQSESPRSSVSSYRSELSIPKDLTLDRILENKTCSPMSLHDFYMYLRHVEFSQENLEFYLWFKDYEARYKEHPPPNTKEASTQTDEIASTTTTKFQRKFQTTVRSQEMCSLIESNTSPEFIAYLEALVLHRAARYPKPCCSSFAPGQMSGCDTNPVADASQYQHELQQIASLFLSPSSPKELNIPPSMRKAVMANIVNHTSDSPQIFNRIAEHVFALLKNCSHRNFVRLGVNNGTFETLCMVTFVGILFSILGFLVMLILAFASPSIHQSSRWRGLASIPFWLIGISFLLAGMRGSCFLLLLFSRRQELPWERLCCTDDGEKNSVLTEGSKVSKYSVSGFAKKMMIFERKIRVKDVGLRRLQRKIVIQSIVGAVVGTAVLEVAFLCLPVWKD